MEQELILQRDLDLLQALNCVEWPQRLAALPDVVLELFANEFVNFSLTFHMEMEETR